MVQLYCPEVRDGFCRYPEGSHVRLPLLDWALCEAHRHVWWESEKQRRSLGLMAWLEWKEYQWPLFLGHRRQEHLLGERMWAEFPEELHGVARRLPQNAMLDSVLANLRWGWENLDFYSMWDLKFRRRLMVGALPVLISARPETELLDNILESLHLNSMRPDFPEDPTPPPSGCYSLAG